ncbi:ABC transporter ATP-binding protein [Staphylococcus simiae]|uniref:ABC transporter, ATP-binding protein n=1 Tax=Staphylococcus simiae CCM 7213 = CCUG 51256 TaxID=911238 RepID=G5JFG4_9STAP|nr:ABC transporter ATP-binding protein [Staphylococcus simiae]EHJ09081.1 ABC transporter, ATP-binding protein [Staphylococcus simiae CCM 7213 = CCUG 51256]PNZ11207.1 ABC transporter ATP-binding protein [Staphylococcus simiae]SNV77694.1 ATP-binding ATP transporter protein [Staphylococcus simiae]
MLIQLSHVGRVKQGKEILHDINWQIEEGDKWILYGLNGAGKTTLLNILNAYDSITQGQLTLFNMTPGKVGYSADAVRQQIGYVSNSLMDKFQEGEIVIDAVISGAFKSIGVYKEVSNDLINEAKKWLQHVGMLDFENQYLGYLSTGEKQRVMIARALMGQPKILILDEPASGLDFVSREELLKTINTLCQAQPQLAMIYVTHFIEEINQQFDHMMLLKDGQCFKQGTTTDVLTSATMSQFFNQNVMVKSWNHRYALFLDE